MINGVTSAHDPYWILAAVLLTATVIAIISVAVVVAIMTARVKVG